MKKRRASRSLCVVWWARLDLNQGPIGYASRYRFRDPFRVRELDYPFTPMDTGGLSSSLYTLSDTTSDLGSGLPYPQNEGGFRLPRI